MYFYLEIIHITNRIKKSLMKKIILLAISILMVTAAIARTTNPIPSYNVPLKGSAIFQENNPRPTHNDNTDEKRDMTVSNDGTAGNGNGMQGAVIAIYVYRLDGSKTYGPFFIPAGTSKTVSIDGKSWGVSAYTSTETFMSVWTSDDL
jgi:hypothetical protein